MSRYIAFLRAINVGGRTISMDILRHSFESLSFTHVESFIASGNIIFESRKIDKRCMEKEIEEQLRSILGYEVATFIRSDAELAEIASYSPFPQPLIEAAAAFNVAFTSEIVDEKSERKLMLLKTDIDDFQIHKREIYWLCRRKQSESKFSNAILEKTIGGQSTLRGINTIRKIADKYTHPSE